MGSDIQPRIYAARNIKAGLLAVICMQIIIASTYASLSISPDAGRQAGRLSA